MNRDNIAKAAIAFAQSAYSASAAAKTLHDLDSEACNAILQAYRLCLAAKEACEYAAVGLPQNDALHVQLRHAIAEAEMRIGLLKPYITELNEE